MIHSRGCATLPEDPLFGSTCTSIVDCFNYRDTDSSMIDASAGSAAESNGRVNSLERWLLARSNGP